MVIKKLILFTTLVLIGLSGCEKEEIEPYQDYYANNPMVHQEGTAIVDGDGQVLQLKGTIPLGWTQWEGTLWNCGLRSETRITDKLIELVGQPRFDAFKDSVYAVFLNEQDIAQMAAHGYNCVRLPFNHTLLEDDAAPYIYKQEGWEVLDDIIDACEAYGVYVVLDLHSAAGGQSNLFISDPDNQKLWQNSENQNRTIELWRAIALRYKDREIVAGYNLLNEPDFPDVNKLIRLCKDIIGSVREVDPYHMFFIDGNNYAVNFNSFSNPFSLNMAWSFHSYDLLNINAQTGNFQRAVEAGSEHQVPIWNGEFGANDLAWTEDVVQMFDNSSFPVSGWIFWPWKRVPDDVESYRGLYYVNAGTNWDKVCKFIDGTGPQPSASEAESGLAEFIEASRIQNCELDAGMSAILN